MPKTPNLTAAHLRDLARTGAEVTITRLRAEIIAIERTFPELRLPQGRRAVRRSLQTVAKTYSHNVRCSAQSGVRTDEALLG